MANFKWTKDMFIDLAELNPRGQLAYQQAADILNKKYNTYIKLENVKQQMRDILYTGGINKFLDAFENNKPGYSDSSKKLLEAFYSYNPGSGGKSQGDPERQAAWIKLLDELQKIEGHRKKYSTVRQYAQVRWGKRHTNHSYEKPKVHNTLKVLAWPEYFFGKAKVECNNGHITEKSLGSLNSSCYFCAEESDAPCYLYYIKITDKDDKIGISQDTNRRWPKKEVLRNVLLTRKECWDIEQTILKKFDQYKTYCEDIKGNGWTETLCVQKRDDILEYFDFLVDDKNTS